MYVLHILQRYPKGRIGLWALCLIPLSDKTGMKFPTQVFKHTITANYHWIPMSDFLTAILCLVFYLNVWLLLTLVKWHTCHLHVNTHGCASGHTTDVRHPRARVCVFFFLVVWFGHTNAWCTSTQQSQCHTNINTHTHTQIQSSHSFTYFPALLLLTTSPF